MVEVFIFNKFGHCNSWDALAENLPTKWQFNLNQLTGNSKEQHSVSTTQVCQHPLKALPATLKGHPTIC